MEHTLQSQLLMVPIPRLATVLRVNVELSRNPNAFESTARLIAQWWNKKAEPYGTRIEDDEWDFSFNQNRFKVEYARTSRLFALAMEEPDSDPTLQRDWICDFGLRQMDDRTYLEVRVSYRQPNNEPRRPEPRAPRLLRDLLTRVGAFDVEAMSVDTLRIDGEQVDTFINLLFAPQRLLPVIAVSEENLFSQQTSGTSKTSAELLASSLSKTLAGAAHTVYLTPDASWQLTKTLTTEWSVFQGAVRCYNPQMQWTDDRFKHRLWLARDVQRSNAANRNGFLNTCSVHVFTQVTAHFESLQMLSPATIRRQAAAETAVEAVPQSDIEIDTPFTLVEPRKKPKQLSLDVTVVPNDATIQNVSDSVDLEVVLRENEELRNALAAITSKLNSAEEAVAAREAAAKDIESQLEQERAGRAEDAQLHQEVKDDLWLNQEEIRELKERDSLLQGGTSETSEALKPLWGHVSSMFQTMQHVATQFRRLEQDSSQLSDMLDQNSVLNEKLAKLQAKLDSLSLRPSTPILNEDEHAIPRAAFAKLLSDLVKRSSLATVLQCFSLMFSDRCVVLDSAVASAEESEEFRQTGKAFDLLCKLATEYWDAMRTGKGDIVARGAFGNETYASKESEKISKDGIKRRTFDYEGQKFYMEKHLKIGTADNSADTLRVHFEWVDSNKIVIGHCGKHLDF